MICVPDPSYFTDQTVIVAIYDVETNGIGPMAVNFIKGKGDWHLLGVSDQKETNQAIQDRPLLAYHLMSRLKNKPITATPANMKGGTHPR